MDPHRIGGSLRGAALATCALLACSDGKEEVKPDPTPRLGVLELPIAHRTDDALPAKAAQLEITPTALLVDGDEVLSLDKGKLPASELAGYDIAKLKRTLAGKPALAISVYAATPYATLARVLHSAVSAGIDGVTFRVRRPNATSKTGWLTIPRSRFTASADEAKFPETELLAWDSFGSAWEESLAACQVSAKADCGYRPLSKAQGGKLDMLLRVRGTGIALRFRQAGAAPQAPAGAALHEQIAPDGGRKAKDKPKRRKRAELLDGVAGSAPRDEQPPPAPSTEHVFTLRGDQATADPSPITGIVRPVCGSVSCPVVVDADGVSMSGQVLGLLGAAFPDGAPAPSVAWVLPPKGG